MAGESITDEKAIWQVVVITRVTSLEKLAPHDLRRTCTEVCRKADELEQIQLPLGHASIQMTEKYLGTEQNLASAVNWVRPRDGVTFFSAKNVWTAGSTGLVIFRVHAEFTIG